MIDKAKQIVEDLKYCGNINACLNCTRDTPRNPSMPPQCVAQLMEEAADLIESLTAEVEELRTANAGLDRMLCSAQSAAETFERRAEAAEKDLIFSGTCAACTNWNPQCNLCDETNGFVWHGPCAENGGLQ